MKNKGIRSSLIVKDDAISGLATQGLLCENCGWYEDGYCVYHEQPTEDKNICLEHSRSAYGDGDLLGPDA